MTHQSNAPSEAESAHKPESPKKNHVLVEVVTTAGMWPPDGPEEIPDHQKVRVILQKAADKLHLRDTSNWVATVKGREINPDLSYVELSLSGTVIIDYGPREGGGGSE